MRLNGKRSLLAGVVGAIALCAAIGARAQESNTIIGPPQLKDFRIDGRRQVAAPPPAEVQPATPPAQAPTAERPPAPGAERPRTERTVAAPTRPVPAPAPPAAQTEAPVVALDPPATDAPAPAIPVAADASPAPSKGEGTSYWLYALPPAAILALLGFVLVQRRRKAGSQLVDEPAPAAAAPPPSLRADPVPRPWLELSLKAERASFTDTEAELLFELEIANKGGSAARNVRIDVKLFNGGVGQQDKEIGAFFRTAGRETTKLHLPEVEAGLTGVIQGRVTMAREDIRAHKLDERLLFIPVVAVNALYDWGEHRTGQTSKSYIVGRELQQPSEKMGAFRVDLGPRVWRTVGQRPHTLARRV